MEFFRCDVCGEEIEENSAVKFTAFYSAGKTFQIEADLCPKHLKEIIEILRDKFKVTWVKIED